MQKIDAAIKERAIALHKEGKDHYQILKALNDSGIKISYGSVWNTLNTWKKSNAEMQTTAVSNEVELPKVDNQELSGCPLYRFIPKEGIQPQIPEEIEYPKSIQEPTNQPTIISVNTNPYVETSQQPSKDMKDIDFEESDRGFYESEVFTNDDIDYDPETDGDHESDEFEIEEKVRPERRIQDTVPEISERRQARNYESEISESRIQTTRQRQLESWREIQRHEPIAGWTDVMNEVQQEKIQRRNERALIEQGRKDLMRREQLLEQAKNELDVREEEIAVRETKMNEVSHLLSIAKELHGLGVTNANSVIPWIETINERAETEKVDIKTASLHVAQELRTYRQLGNMQKALQQMQGIFEMMNQVATNREHALSVVMELQNRGVGLNQIQELSKMIKNQNDGFGNNGSSIKNLKLDSKLLTDQ